MVVLVKEKSGLTHIFDTAKYRVRLRKVCLEFFGEHPKSFPLSGDEYDIINGILERAVLNKNNAKVTIK